ncbi:MAG: putative cytokinetic ring protein SteA [Andreesenia angusta]|nr:putative cytokinetic ring protein SteA [Andreesenia angusta]
MNVKGTIGKDRRTKDLAKRIKPGEIAVINHLDIDEVAAHSLAEAKISAVLNFDSSISGRYPNQGPGILLEEGIPLFESKDIEIFDKLEEGKILKILDNGDMLYEEEVIGRAEYLDRKKINERLKIGYNNIENELDFFIDNTLMYAKKEKDLVLGNIEIPDIDTDIAGRDVLVLVRGNNYKRDLKAVMNYIDERKPILIGVDGGGDALLEHGYVPDIVIGDMDSVSDKCLRKSKELIVHGYMDGRAPGMDRINELDLKAKIFKSYGTSEDIALLLAYEKEAELIVALGTHSSMIDFLEKGRNGMASTFLVRLKVGDKLVDARGLSKLYKSNFNFKYLIAIFLTAILPIIVIVLLSKPIRDLIQLLQIKLRLTLGV